VKYYWLLEVNHVDLEATTTLEELGATHVVTNTMGSESIRRYIMELSGEEATAIVLRFGDKITIWPVSGPEEVSLRERGFINHK